MDGERVGEELYRRLKQLKKARSERTREQPLPTSQQIPPESGAATRGRWREIAPMVWERTVTWPQLRLPEAEFFSHLLGGFADPANLRFMDTETTGLSGGAGTMVFLSGCALVQDGVLTFHQTLLLDFPGEPAFVRRALDHLGRQTVWVSYNGKSFDSKQLQTRCLMNGIRPAYPFHIDLLYWARRLWKRLLEDCSLTSIEAHVLEQPRVDDLPSIEVPERYFSFLDTGRWDLLEPVFDHHLQDVQSLVKLFVLLEEVLTSIGESKKSIHFSSTSHALPQFDRYQLGRWLLANAHPSGVALLERVIDGPRLMESDRQRAAFYLLRYYRRTGLLSERRRLAEACADPTELYLVEELAKHYEHDQHDPARALELLQSFCRSYPALCGTEQVQRRVARLERKLITQPARGEGES